MIISRALIGALAAGVVLTAATARAQGDPALYQATAVVTGTDMRQRPLGFAECLTEVLVKVSGAPRLSNDPAVAALAAHADTLVETFSYIDPWAWILHHDDQGTYDRSYELTVRFDPAKVDAALNALGAQPWRGPRPLLTPIVIVRRDDTPYLLSIENPRGAEMRATIVRLASAYVRIPTHPAHPYRSQAAHRSEVMAPTVPISSRPPF